jgi:hypothetical protein
LRSDDGGFGFHGPDNLSFTNAAALAYRADVSVALGDLFAGHSGRFTFYKQNLDAGYSAPGQATIRDTKQFGGVFKMPVTSRVGVAAKGDQKIEDQGLETRAVELDITYKLTEFWSASTGVRNDLRRDNSPIVPLTQEQGERTDAVAQVMYDPHTAWRAYGFGQSTVASAGPWRCCGTETKSVPCAWYRVAPRCHSETRRHSRAAFFPCRNPVGVQRPFGSSRQRSARRAANQIPHWLRNSISLARRG